MDMSVSVHLWTRLLAKKKIYTKISVHYFFEIFAFDYYFDFNAILHLIDILIFMWIFIIGMFDIIIVIFSYQINGAL